VLINDNYQYSFKCSCFPHFMTEATMVI